MRDVSGRPLEELARDAAAGDRDAAAAVIAAVAGDVYGLALRMLWHPADAEDAAQEVLIKVLTRLDSFRGESALRTWVFRIACNHLLNVRRGRIERQGLSFEAMRRDLAEGLGPPAADSAEDRVLVEEVKIGCTRAMLQCLDREHRLAYVLGAVYELPGEDAAALLGIAPAAFRKRLSRARDRIRAFMEGTCGLLRPDNACRCARRVQPALRLGRVDPRQLLFQGRPAPEAPSLLRAVGEMERLHDEAAAIHRASPDVAAPAALLDRVRRLLDSRSELLGS